MASRLKFILVIPFLVALQDNLSRISCLNHGNYVITSNPTSTNINNHISLQSTSQQLTNSNAPIHIGKPNITNQISQIPNQRSQHQHSILNNNFNAVNNSNVTPPIGQIKKWLAKDDMHVGESRLSSSLSFTDLDSNESYRADHNKSKSRRKNHSTSKHFNNSSSKDDLDFDAAESSDQIFDDADEAAGSAGSSQEPVCAGHGRYYCTSKEEYPYKLVTEVTKYYKWPLEKLFRDLHAQIMPKLAQESTGNLVCDSITRVVRPGWARNTNDRWLVVINTENYHQYVTEIVCQYGSNSRCNFIPPCYYSSCQQRYNTQKLLVIDPNNPYRGPFLSEFLFPSCCVCYVPSTIEGSDDKYRTSPATIYQRTMQQVAASNKYPPQVSQPGSIGVRAYSNPSNQGPSYQTSASHGGQKTQDLPPNPLEPGEIRRDGEQVKSAADNESRKSLDKESEANTHNNYQGDNDLRTSSDSLDLTNFPSFRIDSGPEAEALRSGGPNHITKKN